MSVMMGLDFLKEKEELSNEIFQEMWKYCGSYSIGNAENVEDKIPIWYITDEVGSAVVHSNEPNVNMVPFIYIPDQITYSLLFPVRNVECGETIARDFAVGIVDETNRKIALLPWQVSSFLDEDSRHLTPTSDYFLNGHIPESLPDLPVRMERKNVYKVYTQYQVLFDNLKDPRFQFVDNEEEADILWLTTHFKNFKDLPKHQFVNQFPYEYVVTIKDLLCITCRRNNQSEDCLPITYNLVTEKKQFLSHFQRKQTLNEGNYWILKPFNLARGLDTHITNNLNFIIKLALTGSPKIAQKYIENPVLFDRDVGKVKFDVRYVILLKSTKPLEVYVYKNFFLRFANKPFSLDNFQEYQKHFTVMNYTENAPLKKMLCSEFKSEWARQYPNKSWEGVEQKIFKMLRKVFECATIEDPPCGIAESPQSRALYAADIMLEWDGAGDIQEKLLEINWTPDCKRACEYYPDFYDNVFRLLYLDEVEETQFVCI